MGLLGRGRHRGNIPAHRTRAGRGGLFLLVLAGAALVHPGTAAAASIESYGQLPALEDVSLSPDGTKIAFVRQVKDRRVIAVKSLADMRVLNMLDAGDVKVRAVQWADEQHLLVTTSTTSFLRGYTGGESEWSQLVVYDLASHESKTFPDTFMLREGEYLNVIAGPVMVRRVNGHTMLFVHGYRARDHLFMSLFRMDLATGEQKCLQSGTIQAQGWLVDAAGNVAAARMYDEEKHIWWLRAPLDGDDERVAVVKAPIELPHIVGLGADDDTVLFARILGGEEGWVPFNLRTHQFGTPVAGTGFLGDPIESPATHRVIGGTYVGDDTHYVFFDPAQQKRWDNIVRAFPGSHLRLMSVTEKFHKFVVRVDGPAFGYLYELVDLDAHRADPVGEVYEGVNEPLEVRRIDYPAADGLPVPAYLTVPRGHGTGHWPLIVLPHGGPAVRDTADFDWWSQALADQGYAVLRPNYRGSDLGDAYLALGNGEFGRKMQTDLSDGVRFLAREGIADPARVCIVGASYGGYAALAGVTMDPGVYRCAVSVAGIADLKSFLSWVNEKYRRGTDRPQQYWDRLLGVTGPDDPLVDALSPIRHADALSVPVLLIHGKDDTIVPFDQSDDMYDALRARHKQVEFVKLRHEDHWLSRSETRLQMLRATVDFLRAHNPPD